ncbi:MAG TPA: transporter, partial [Desulfobacterales bacterium]|nr:transporter [Desulfobacterales bacterium]
FRLLGGFYGAEILVPLAVLDFKTEFGPNDHDHGLGDIAVSPFFIQWPEHKLFGLPFYQRLDFLYKIDTWLLYLNSYYETGAENRPEGVKFVFRISKLF